jgi:hypothetical protein
MVRGSTGFLPGAKRGGERLQDGSWSGFPPLSMGDCEWWLRHSTPSSWPPLAFRPVQWPQSITFSANLVTARVQRVSTSAG